MYRSGTLASFARKERVLVALLAAAAALAALGPLAGVRWLAGAGLVIAAVGLLGRLILTWGQTRVEGAQEQAKLDRRLHCPIAPVDAIDPTRIGVDPAAQEVLPGGAVPRYVARDADGALRDALRAAVAGAGPWIVVVVGSTKVGKSRTLFEALRACARETALHLVAPVDADAVLGLITPGELPPVPSGCTVLWLDDLEPFLDQGVTLRTLREWHATVPKGIVVATYGGKGSGLVAEPGSEKLTTMASTVLGSACEVPLGGTSAHEVEPFRERLAAETLEAIERYGLAAFLVAAPELDRKLATRRHAPGEPECPDGAALVEAAVDWARCGRTDAISAAALRTLWPAYLPDGAVADDGRFETAVEWALRPVVGAIALLLRDGEGHRAYDYVVRSVAGAAGQRAPRDAAWSAALADATDAEALAVADAAYAQARREDAARAFAAASRSRVAVVAAIASYDLGVVLGELGREDEALAAYEEFLQRFAGAEEVAMRVLVAQALVNKGVLLGALGRSQEELDAYDEVAERFGAAQELALRDWGAKALFNKAVALGRSEAAMAAYAELVRRFGAAEELALREQVAKALLNKGVGLDAQDRREEALEAYDELLERFGAAEESVLREQVASALVNRGVALGMLDRWGEALDAYEELLERFGAAEGPALREQVAKTLLNKGVTLAALGKLAEGRTVLADVISRFGDDDALESVVSAARAALTDIDEIDNGG